MDTKKESENKFKTMDVHRMNQTRKFSWVLQDIKNRQNS